MASGGRRAPKRKTKCNLQSNGSDASDEDYIIGEDEALDDLEDEILLADDETGGFEEENELEECAEKKIKKVGRPKGQNSSQRKSRAVKPRKRTRVSCSKKSADTRNKKPRKRTKVSYQRGNKDSDFYDSDEDESDDEFMPDEVDFMDDDEESPHLKMNKVERSKMQEANTAKGKKRKKNPKAARTKRKKTVKKPTLRRKRRYNSKKSRGKGTVSKRRKLNASSNTDLLKSGLSDYDYTISEEERQQIREAGEFCGRLTNSSRSSSSVKTIKDKTVPSERKCTGSNDKGKMVDKEVKQVCGICLSEEGKRSIRGILNCCSHYFCFACIMEWSKVESRCPLCKQRFTAIRRTDNSSRGAVISIPKCDQVYLPSEEEIRGFIDPYANVLCTECHQGVDDALMLLCDLCDSSAHTYCVGLGRFVPEGNWYCDGCRPGVLAHSNTLPLNPVTPALETFDPYEVQVPQTALYREVGSGSGAFTLHERRQIQERVRHLLRDYASTQTEMMHPLSGTENIGDIVAPQQPVTSHVDEVQLSVGLTDQVLHHEASTSTVRPPGDQQCIRLSTSSEKEHVQSLVKSHLKSLSRNLDIGYDTFKRVARSCTHTILGAVGVEHRPNEVFPTRTRLLVCDHFDDIGSLQIYPAGGQCSSCFDWFIRNVVREVLSNHQSSHRCLLSRD